MFQALEQIKRRFFDKNKRKTKAKAMEKAKRRVVVDRICVMGSKIYGRKQGFKRRRACKWIIAARQFCPRRKMTVSRL